MKKQLNWGIKGCFIRNKYDSSSDLKLMYDIMPIRFFLNTKASIYFWKFKNNLIPAFLREIKPSSAVLRKQNKTNWEYFNLIQRTDSIGKCSFKRVIALWNTLNLLKQKNMLMLLRSKKIKLHFPIRFHHEAFRSELGMKCWSSYEFK